MRGYLIDFITQRNDECVDLQAKIEAEEIGEALTSFKLQNRNVQRITGINEISANRKTENEKTTE